MTENKISLNTLLPLSVVMTILGGSFWFGVLYHEVQQGRKENERTLALMQEFKTEIKGDIQYLASKFDQFILMQNQKKVALLDQK